MARRLNYKPRDYKGTRFFQAPCNELDIRFKYDTLIKEPRTPLEKELLSHIDFLLTENFRLWGIITRNDEPTKSSPYVDHKS